VYKLYNDFFKKAPERKGSDIITGEVSEEEVQLNWNGLTQKSSHFKWVQEK
jgi:hypothetical protein